MLAPSIGRAVVLALLTVAVTAGSAAADRPLPDWEFIDGSRANLTRPVAGGAPPSRLIYMNDCKAGDGCRITPGSENSRTNRSTVARRASLVPAFPHSPQVWARTLECVKKTYARFDIKVTDVDPCPDPNAGCLTPHWEIVVAGRAEDIGYVSQSGGTVGGVSPFDRSGCSIIDNSITYAFAAVIGPNVDQLCWTIAQETAHSFGLDHELLGADPMTYLPNPPHKEFQDVEAQCGETAVRACYCGFSRRNSVRELLAMFGAAPASPPVVTILEPRPGAVVAAGFPVQLTVADDQGVAQVELVVDGVSILTLESPPFVFNAPATLAAGGHRVEVRATDWNGTPGAATVDVRIDAACALPSDCAVLGADYTCAGGRCVVGPGVAGGLGETCVAGDDCGDGVCATKGGDSLCTAACAPGSGDCPSGFTCETIGDGTGLCWPAEDSGGCGCAATGSGHGTGSRTPLAPIGISLVLSALLLRRRRRSAV